MFKTIVDELIAIKKELQDIKLILKFHFLSNYKTNRRCIQKLDFVNIRK